MASLVTHGALVPLPGAEGRHRRERQQLARAAHEGLKDLYKKMPQDFLEDPVAVIKRNISVSPFWEEDLDALADLLGEDHVLFGSDYPHPEGLAEPRSYLAELEGATAGADRQDHGWQPRPPDERGEHAGDRRPLTVGNQPRGDGHGRRGRRVDDPGRRGVGRAARHGDAPAVVDGATTLTFAALAAEARTFAGALVASASPR